MTKSTDYSSASVSVPLSQQARSRRHQEATIYLDTLNVSQRAAVEALDGAVLVLAGAGTGKTKTLTTRIVHLLNTNRAGFNEILAVTFTNKAAHEMKQRVANMLSHKIEGMPWMGTFHSIGVKLLRRHSELLGLNRDFTILDTDDQLRLLKKIIRSHNIDEKRWPPRYLLSLIDGWKNAARLPHRVPKSEDTFDGRGIALYAEYQERLKILNAVDFGDLLLHVVELFSAHDDILQKYQKLFRYILVDEYQDINTAQYKFLSLLAAAHHNICCVGDDDQSIYGWRGADVTNILRFESDFKGATIIRLEQNYRSTHHILAAASKIIDSNENRLGKTLWTERNDGDKLRLINHWDSEEEARWIGEDIESYQRGYGSHALIDLNKIAILVRTSHQMRVFEDRFLQIGMPYRVIGGPRFYERQEIRDAMAYFRLVVNMHDDLAFERIVNTPKRGLGDKTQQHIFQLARERGISLYDSACYIIAAGGLTTKARYNLGQFLRNIKIWHDKLIHDELSHVDLGEIILDESDYTTYWKNNKSPDSEGRLDNLKELIKALNGFENMQGFLEHVSLVMDNSRNDDTQKISIMTLHAAKGLEFPMVYLPGWEEGLFPSQRAMDDQGKKGIEEERRLAYVGITRAEKICTISFANNRQTFGKWHTAMPSRFIDELPEDHVEVLNASDVYSGGHTADHTTNDKNYVSLDYRANGDVYNSPGWRRMQARMAHRNETINKPITIAKKNKHNYCISSRVRHRTLGLGTVIGIEEEKLSVVFDQGGAKKIMADFLTPVDDILF